MAASLSSSNGIAIETGECTFRLDPGRTVKGDFNVISHAHSDHLPRGGDETAVIASNETLLLAELRTRKHYTSTSHESVSLLEAGHVPGSKMIMVKDELTYLYTGDFCTKKKVYLDNARPAKTDVLVIESTYGLPDYRFPDPVELAGVIRDWTADALSLGRHVVFTAYPLGKAQELQVILGGMPLFADDSVLRHNAITMGGQDAGAGPLAEVGNEPSVIVSSSRNVMVHLPSAVRRNALTATASGWCLDGAFRGRSGYDEAFPLSDHCDYYDLMEFVRGCGPSAVYTVHGFEKELAASIKKELGIDARPLRQRPKGQKRIDSY